MYHFIFFFVGVLILFFGSRLKYRSNSLAFFGFFVFIAVYAGLRGDVGQDTLSYQIIYDSTNASDLSSNFIFEPLFVLIVYFHKSLFDDITFFFLVVAFLQSLVLYYASRNLVHRWSFVFFYFVIFYLNFYFNVIRAGLALNFFLLALSFRRCVPSYFFLFLAVLTHLSIVFVLPFYFVRRAKKTKNLLSLFVFGISFVFLIFLSFGDYIYSKLYGYGIIGAADYGFSFGTFFFFVFGFFLLVYPFRSPRKIVLYCLIFVLVFYFSNYIDILYRVRNLAFCVLIFLMLENRMFSLSGLILKSSFVWLLALVLWTGQQQWRGYLGERDAVAFSGRGNLDFTYIPYEPYLDSDYRK